MRRMEFKHCQNEGDCALTAVRKCDGIFDMDDQAIAIAALDRASETLPIT